MLAWLFALFVFRGASFDAPTLSFNTTPAPSSFGPGAGPWEIAKPTDVGLRSEDLDVANKFIRDNVLDRQCFLLIKDGKMVYEWYDPKAPDPPLTPHWSGSPESKPHHGFSMTKTIGGFLILFAATLDGLDIDADITEKFHVPSPRPYGVTLRMMMAQVVGGSRPGEEWRYDELGDMYLHIFPSVILAATGHKASYYFDRLHVALGLSAQFTWPQVDTTWFRGASGSCRDWARFGQLILNGGEWGGKQLIASRWITEMQQPVKYAPYNSYSNPCYGLLLWVNADKSKYPGCCWEASRLPDPKCNDETFMDGAVNDLTLNIGLYGQLVMTLPSVNTVVVGFGRDLRPIEPARIGYYPGVCKALGIPCNKPPPVPRTKCGERLQCTGVSAQCYSGGSWSHKEPKPGREQCVSCFQNRLPAYEKRFPEAHDMVQNWCPNGTKEAFEFVECFCGMTGRKANPFSPWPSTTTTTPLPGPAPPPGPVYPTPAPPSPGPACELTPRCIAGLNAHYDCYGMSRNGGHNCYRGLQLHQKTLSDVYGCPNFLEKDTPVIQSKAFCWCGLDPDPTRLELSLPFPPSHPQLEALRLENDSHPQPEDLSFTSEPLSQHEARVLLSFRSKPDSRPFLGKPNHGGLCHNRKDAHLRKMPQSWIESAMYSCAQQQYGKDGKGHGDGTGCMALKLRITYPCAICFENAIRCQHDNCLEQCACGQTPACHQCGDRHCKTAFNICSGHKGLSTSVTFGNLTQDSVRAGGSGDEFIQIV